MAKIKKTKSGKYHTMVFIGYDVQGKRKYKSITAPTQKEVRQKVAQALLEGVKETKYSSLTLAEAYERYIDSKDNVLSPSTLRGYRSNAKNDFPRLQPLLLSQLNNEIIQKEINALVPVNSPKTIKNKYNLLRSVLNVYLPELHLHIQLPQNVKTNVPLHTEETIHLLLSKADDRLRVPILLAAFGGLRRSEICALTKEDFTDKGVNVNKAKVLGDFGYVIKQPKTDAGYRFVPLSQEIIKECREWKHFGLNPDIINNGFQTLRQQCDVPATFHKLRHYYGTMLLKQGIDIMTACKYGGWDEPQILLQIYAHAIRDSETDEKAKSIYSLYSEKCSENRMQQ